MWPSLNWMDSKSAPPMPWTMAPMFWLRSPSGLTMAPDSQACTTRAIWTFLVAGSIATSAQVATHPPFSCPQALPNPMVGEDLHWAQPHLADAALGTATRRGSVRFFWRKASESMPLEWASPSMKDSRAKWLAVEARPRYEPWRRGDFAP